MLGNNYQTIYYLWNKNLIDYLQFIEKNANKELKFDPLEVRIHVQCSLISNVNNRVIGPINII